MVVDRNGVEEGYLGPSGLRGGPIEVARMSRRLFFGCLNRALLDQVRRENKGGGGLVGVFFFFSFPTPRQAVFLTLAGGVRRMAYGVGLLFRLYAEHGASGVSRSSSRRTGMATGTGLGRQVGASQRAGRGTEGVGGRVEMFRWQQWAWDTRTRIRCGSGRLSSANQESETRGL
ncbi:hypothetical protein CGRA01v4_05621 [Colletotrichum graminicola]|nr:hypothetical protein CGRA01v4_05621 [Colletotrichum graminicola]